MSEELKPCPFCGGEAFLRYSHKGEFYFPVCEVACNECGSQTRQYPRKFEDVAIEKWNTRAPVKVGAWECRKIEEEK